MRHLSILVPAAQCNPGTVACIVGAYDIFSNANAQWKNSGRTVPFKLDLVGNAADTSLMQGLMSIKPNLQIDDLDKTDLIIVPASMIRNYEDADAGNRKLMDWLAKQYQARADIAGLCSGVFTLAAAGIMEEMTCSTHWSLANDFRRQFPDSKMKEDKLITDEKGIYTVGGAYSFLHLMIYLVEKYYDRPTAVHCAKVFQIDIDRNAQSPYSIFAGQKQHDDALVLQAQAFIEANLEVKLSVEALSERFAVGRRNFDRRFVRATGNTPLEYAQRLKVEAAKKSFENSRKSIAEVMFEVGYSDAKAFREVFRKFTGMSPLAYREKYCLDGRTNA